MGVNAEAIDDLFNMVIDDHFTFGKSFADLAALWPDAFVASRVLDRSKKKGGSHTVTWRLKVRNVGNYRSDVGLYDEDQPARDDMFVEARDRYTGFNIGTFYDVNEEEFMSPDVAVKVDYLKELINAAIQRLKLSFSADLWSYPATAAAKGLHGFPYWITKSTATTVTGFNHDGASVYGDDTVGNVDVSTYTQYRNGTGVFGTLASEDGLDLLSEAMDRSHFRTQSDSIGSPDSRSLPNWSLYTTYENFQSLERYTRNQNDNVGKDLGMYRGSVVFRQLPIMYLWEFSESEIEDGLTNPAYAKHGSTNQIYGVNWSTFRFLHKLGTGFEKTGPRQAPNQRFVRRVDWDQFAQLVCDDRRKNFVLHQAS